MSPDAKPKAGGKAQDWRDILVLAEPRGRAPDPAGFEAVGKARELADRLGARVLCAWPGDGGEGQALVHRGADELLVLEGARDALALKAALVALVQERRPELVLAPASPLGQELAGRLAAALGVGVIAGCSDLDLDEAARLFVGKRLTHDGALVETLKLPKARPQVATLRPGAVRAPWPDEGRYARVTRVEVPAGGAAKLKRLGAEDAKPPEGWRGAERLVVGGALLGKEDFEALRSLAEKLGASWAVTRAAAKLGLGPEDRALRPWDGFAAPVLCIAAGIEDPFEFTLALPPPRQLVLLGEGPLERTAHQVVPGDPGAALRALAERVR